jgi:hypothetical protein
MFPIRAIILNDTQGVDPQITDIQPMTNESCILECRRQLADRKFKVAKGQLRTGPDLDSYFLMLLSLLVLNTHHHLYGHVCQESVDIFKVTKYH